MPDTNVDPHPCNNFIGSNSSCIEFSPASNASYTYFPPLNNIMSYHWATMTAFSPTQLSVMKEFLEENSNWSFLIDPNQAACTGTVASSGSIKRGKLTSGQAASDPIPSINISISTSSQTSSLTTSSGGEYIPSSVGGTNAGVINFGPANNNSLVFAASNGLSTFDLIKLQQHITGSVPFTHPYQLIAGDVSGNGSVSTFDLIKVQQVILGQATTLPVDSWRFIPEYALNSQLEDFNLGTMQEGFSAGFYQNPFSVEWVTTSGNKGYNSDNSYFNAVSANAESGGIFSNAAWSFIGIKSGDINFSADLNISSNMNSISLRSGENDKSRNFFKYPNKSLDCIQEGEEFVISVLANSPRLNKSILGYQFGIGYNNRNLEFIGLLKEGANFFDPNSFNVVSDEGKILTAWVYPGHKSLDLKINKSTELFSIYFKAKNKICDLKEDLWQDLKELDVLFIDRNEQQVDLDLELNLKIKKLPSFLVESTYPNPARNIVTFEIFSDKNQAITLNLNKIINPISKRQRIILRKGQNKIEVSLQDLQEGVLNYSLVGKGHTITGQIIKIHD